MREDLRGEGGRAHARGGVGEGQEHEGVDAEARRDALALGGLLEERRRARGREDLGGVRLKGHQGDLWGDLRGRAEQRLVPEVEPVKGADAGGGGRRQGGELAQYPHGSERREPSTQADHRALAVM
jgi:hypothetical protein